MIEPTRRWGFSDPYGSWNTIWNLGVEVAATTSGGLLVTKVQPGGPAATAGIVDGELITAVDGTATPDQASLADVLAGLNPGRTVTLTVARPGGARRTVRVALGQYPG